ncbi:MAG: ABC transporter permease, partial [Rikenellaceae bacterium]
KGIEDEERLNFYKKYLVSGELPSITGEKRVREVILSAALAKQLKMKSGDMLETLFFEDPPLRERFKVTGIYDTAIGTLDKTLIITDLRNVQYIYEWDENQIAGYDVTAGSGYIVWYCG